MNFDKMIPLTFQPALEPLAQHIIDSQKSATPLEPPSQFKAGRRFAFAMVKGTIGRLRKEHTVASDLSKPIVSTAIPVADDWRIIRPQSEGSGVKFPQPGELLDDGTAEFPEGEIPGAGESQSNTMVTNEITIDLAQSINISITVNLLQLDYIHHNFPLETETQCCPFQLFHSKGWEKDVAPDKWRVMTKEDGTADVTFGESNEAWQSVAVNRNESDEGWKSDGAWDSDEEWFPFP
ncbi:hypothetical protein EDB81DRAFT_413457 [Dactylonectria macrodidyma]|uniref:Uncharacterized protein n=1 Tax=Dactylonectria macrodidyma TaxID=307937 RepID=A0A9P9JGG5_9HYPO|nr:hypothetical protein EDB81DRAFT_413457 [Dactylonectria macrodidyma]